VPRAEARRGVLSSSLTVGSSARHPPKPARWPVGPVATTGGRAAKATRGTVLRAPFSIHVCAYPPPVWDSMMWQAGKSPQRIAEP